MSDQSESYCVDCRKEVLDANVIMVHPETKGRYCPHQRMPSKFRFVDASGNVTYMGFRWSGDVDVLNR